eukprot:TRINITY_DN65517_c0_g1_i1.p1 TRINITY_DN65517_c0_g1~~TRINITY_DN65517_c0_g1_i1.p1  ORF type:complete len:749 (+),score=203.74 TRINITY_DN65517_c0_g1_i1:107-2248(+)
MAQPRFSVGTTPSDVTDASPDFGDTKDMAGDGLVETPVIAPSVGLSRNRSVGGNARQRSPFFGDDGGGGRRRGESMLVRQRGGSLSRRQSQRRATLVRAAEKSYTDRRMDVLQDELRVKRIRADLSEACQDLRQLSAQMARTRVFDLRQDALTNWGEQINERVSVIEKHSQGLLFGPPRERRMSSPEPDLTPPRSSPGPAALRRRGDSGEPADPEPPVSPTGPGALVNAPNFHVPVTTALYLVMESIAQRLRAERATMFSHIPRSDELQAVCLINSGDLRPSRVRVSALSGWAGQVFSTGVGVNMNNAYAFSGTSGGETARTDKATGFRTRSMLCLPVVATDSRRRIGVIQLLNKNRGTAVFTCEDEVLLQAHTCIVAYLLQRYPADHFNNTFDPSTLHRVVPYTAPEPQVVMLPSSVVKNTPQLVFRTSTSVKALVKDRNNPAAVAASIIAEAQPIEERDRPLVMEVDAYLGKVEECWQRSVALNMEYEREVRQVVQKEEELRNIMRQQNEAMRGLNSELGAKDREIAALQSRLQQLEQQLQAYLDTASPTDEGAAESGAAYPDSDAPTASPGRSTAGSRSRSPSPGGRGSASPPPDGAGGGPAEQLPAVPQQRLGTAGGSSGRSVSFAESARSPQRQQWPPLGGPRSGGLGSVRQSAREPKPPPPAVDALGGPGPPQPFVPRRKAATAIVAGRMAPPQPASGKRPACLRSL